MDAGAHEGERERLVDAALDLIARQGYHGTTVEQLAAAADLTPGEFASYFTTKDAVIMSVVDDLLQATAAALGHVETDADPAEALLVATTEVLAAVIEGRGAMPLQRMLGMARIVITTRDLQEQASAVRKHVLTQALAARMGVAPENRRVRRAITMWSATAATSYMDHLDIPARPRDRRHGKQLSQQAIARLVQTYAKVTGQQSSLPN